MSPYVIAAFVVVIVILVLVLWLWISEADAESPDSHHDTEALNDAFASEADSTSDERKHHG